MLEGYENIKEFDPEKMHITNTIRYEDRLGNRRQRGIGDLIEWMNKEMVEEGMEGIFITNKISDLYKTNKLRYKQIMDN